MGSGAGTFSKLGARANWNSFLSMQCHRVNVQIGRKMGAQPPRLPPHWAWVSFCIGLVRPKSYQYFRKFNVTPMALHGKNCFEVVKINIGALPIIFRKRRSWPLEFIY